MIGTRAFLHRSGPRLAQSILRKEGALALSTRALHVEAAWNASSTSSRRQPRWSTAIRCYSPTNVDATATNTEQISRPLRILKEDAVKQIMEELRSVDTNSDGRIETDELKALLHKHSKSFTADEIAEIGEYFYAGKSGGSVSFDRFIEAIDRVMQRETHPDIPKDDDGNPLELGNCGNEFLFYKPHGNYSQADLDIELTHTKPEGIRDRLAYSAVKAVRWSFDKMTGWNYKSITQDMVLQRVIYLETIAAVPGMVAAIVRHFRSLRSFQRDGGMMQMFLDEANNERMHLLSFVRMKDPSTLFRAAVIGGQAGFGSAFLLLYVISPKFCHRFVGYVEEEACTTYTKIIKAIEDAPEDNELAAWRTQLAPSIARSYWKLGEYGTVLELMYAVRADEAEHRDVNHLCSEMKDGMQNPIANTEEKLNTMLLKYAKDMMDRSPEVKDVKNVKVA